MKDENNRYKELADFLKTRRARILPSQVGLAAGVRRRTPGLRREEVAQLAGIGLTWYTWLEQGRPIHVSTQVIESLSKVLLLDKQERIHLHLLANKPLPVEIPRYEGLVNPVLQNVINSMSLSPTIIVDQRWNAVAWNEAANVIFGDFGKMNVRERNAVWSTFTNEKYKQLYVEWSTYAKGLLSRFRATFGQYVEDTWFVQLVEELKSKSPEFNAWWPLYEIQNDNQVYKQLNHPAVGIMNFELSRFDVSDNSGLSLIVHTPSPGTDTDEKMKALRGRDCFILV